MKMKQTKEIKTKDHAEINGLCKPSGLMSGLFDVTMLPLAALNQSTKVLIPPYPVTPFLHQAPD